MSIRLLSLLFLQRCCLVKSVSITITPFIDSCFGFLSSTKPGQSATNLKKGNGMKRTIIRIDADLCNGCGICVSACEESAIEIINGKATLVRENFCDGLGNCLPACPQDAITFEEREAPAFDAAAVEAFQKEARPVEDAPDDDVSAAEVTAGDAPVTGTADAANASQASCGCPGAAMRDMRGAAGSAAAAAAAAGAAAAASGSNENAAVRAESALRTWPIQMKLVPVNAPYFNGSDLLIAADCAAFASGNFHADYMRDHVTVIGCPKLDAVDYSEKLAAILGGNDIKSVTVVRMEVPCCGGLTAACRQAIEICGEELPLRVVTLSVEGKVLKDER